MQWNSDEVGDRVWFVRQTIMATILDRNGSKTLQEGMDTMALSQGREKLHLVTITDINPATRLN
jgi:hypothetical protein